MVDRDDTSVRSQSNPSRYHVGVFKRLKDFKESDPTNLENSEALEMVQVEIEEMTLDYDEQGIYKTSRDLIQLMIHDNEPSVRDMILQMKGIADEVSVILNNLGGFTCEAIAIHVLSELFHETSYSTVVRAATFIDHLARLIKFNFTVSIEYIYSQNDDCDKNEGTFKGSTKIKDKKAHKSECPYIKIASYIVEFLIERSIIRLTDEFTQDAPIVKKGSQYIQYKSKYVECLFDMRILPVKLNLPMISKPKAWEIYNEDKLIETGRVPQMSDLVGGYYTTSKKASMFLTRYLMLTTREYEYFHIRLKSVYSCQHLCKQITSLQDEPFIINSKLLRCIKD